MRDIRPRLEIWSSAFAVTITTILFTESLLYAWHWLREERHPSILLLIGNAVFLFVIVAFTYGNLLYQLTRIGYYKRLGRFVKQSQENEPLEYAIHIPESPRLSVLIPSYKEERVTVMQTLVSAALLGYKNKTVAVLLDDPVSQPGTADYRKTQATIAMVHNVARQLQVAHQQFRRWELAAARRHTGLVNNEAEQDYLARAYAALATWFDKTSRAYSAKSHTDSLFVEKVLDEATAIYRQRSSDIMAAHSSIFTKEFVMKEYAYISDIFATKISLLQRKAYANLPDEPNKAMNINSYISLMGIKYSVVNTEDGHKLLAPATSKGKADLDVPSADYIITLDADSILDHRYAATLIQHMEQPGNERIAVAQTPYSAIRGTNNVLERTAGATTDIQYIIHQGFTSFGATYWVGANALIRTTALQEIAEPIPGQTLVRQYIQDRTVIEDTESSIDLVSKGWSLYNHPERLAFSATPDDYGSLLIQRRRWANGGLIIFPKLVRYLLVWPSIKKIPEGFMRVHYLISIAMVNIGLIVMLFVPLGKVAFSIWVPLTALPYFWLYNRDLRLLGYDRAHIFRVYALNLLLVPINLGGVCKSIVQLVTRKKIPFGRTPKVGNRVSAPPLYHLANFGFVGFLTYDVTSDVMIHRYSYAFLIAINTAFFIYAIGRFVGFSAAFTDILHGLSKRVAIRSAPEQSSIASQ